jgi:hypothetical protein
MPINPRIKALNICTIFGFIFKAIYVVLSRIAYLHLADGCLVLCVGGSSCLSEFGYYVSGSWDKTMRLWLGERHMPKAKRAASSSGAYTLPTAAAPDNSVQVKDTDEFDVSKFPEPVC